MTPFDEFIKNLESKIGLPIEQIRAMCPSEMREYLEKKTGKKMTFTSEPKVEIIHSEDLEKEIYKFLKQK